MGDFKQPVYYFLFFVPVEAYYDSIVGFVFGVSYIYISDFNNKRQRLSVFVVTVVVAISAICMLTGNTQNIWFAIIRNLMGICAVFILWKLSTCNLWINKIFDSVINRKICEISPELYFFHIPICAVIGVSVKNVYIRAIIILVGSFVAATLFNIIHKYIRKRIKI